jgi:N-sulfoglucosamine sulfohydrolase
MTDINRRAFLSTAAGGAAILAMGLSKAFGVEEKSTGKPNIFIYIADDQYLASVGCYGAKPSHTPNIDAFAKRGMLFKSAYCTSSICTPNRAVLLSGLYPVKNGAHPNHSGFKPGIKSLPNYMKELGYRTALVGKDGIKFKNEIYKLDSYIKKSKELVPGAVSPLHDRHLKTDYAAMERFIRKDPSRPFCLVHAASLPHSPELKKLGNGLSGYDASNYYCDYEFGRDLELLDRLGLKKDTLVIYVNDNEAQIPRSKNTLYDTGIHVPMLIRWPGQIKGNSTTDAMVSFLDILPTLIEAGGGAVADNLDGKSFLGVLQGKSQRHNDEMYFSYTGVIVSDGGWQDMPYPIRAIRTRRFKYIRNLNYKVAHPKLKGKHGDDGMRPYEELYDLVKDPKELNNLAGVEEFGKVKKELSDKIDTWMKRVGDRGIEGEKEALQYFDPAKRSKWPELTK